VFFYIVTEDHLQGEDRLVQFTTYY